MATSSIVPKVDDKLAGSYDLVRNVFVNGTWGPESDYLYRDNSAETYSRDRFFIHGGCRCWSDGDHGGRGPQEQDPGKLQEPMNVPLAPGTQKTQGYTFDSFGNLTNIAGTSGRATPTSSATNRLTTAPERPMTPPSLINWNGAVYIYDHFNQMTDMTSGAEHFFYIYTVDDERVWSYDLVRNLSHWTLRDLGGKVLRDYLNNNGTWGLQTDYFYRDGLLLAAETRTGQNHYHLDHLGTPRLITSASGTKWPTTPTTPSEKKPPPSIKTPKG
jgi:hypothetical protein